jgi:cytochrome c biogenesis protein CcdA
MKSIPLLISNVNTWKSYILPGLAAMAALAVAVVGAHLTGEASGTSGVNGFVESLSGRSSSYLGNISFLAPLGFAFAAGMASTVNPCGFAMLPAYLGLYLGSTEEGKGRAHSIHRLAKALLVGGMVTSGFILLFGVAGIVIGAGARSVVDIIPWLGLVTGILVAIGGSWLLGGGKLYSGFATRAAAHIGNPGQVSIKGYFLFGISYGVASLSCVLPIFLVVVVSTITVSGTLEAVGQFVLYALGMGMVIMLLSVGMALFKGAIVGTLRKVLPHIQTVSAVLMLVAGSYIVYYWLTIGDLG